MKEALITLVISNVLISTISVITAAWMLIVLIVCSVRLPRGGAAEAARRLLDFISIWMETKTPPEVLCRAQKQSAMCANVAKSPP